MQNSKGKFMTICFRKRAFSNKTVLNTIFLFIHTDSAISHSKVIKNVQYLKKKLVGFYILTFILLIYEQHRKQTKRFVEALLLIWAHLTTNKSPSANQKFIFALRDVNFLSSPFPGAWLEPIFLVHSFFFLLLQSWVTPARIWYVVPARDAIHHLMEGLPNAAALNRVPNLEIMLAPDLSVPMMGKITEIIVRWARLLVTLILTSRWSSSGNVVSTHNYI